MLKVIDSYSHPDAQLKTEHATHARLAQHIYRPPSDLVLEFIRGHLQGSVLIIHSGSWNFDFDAIYLEPAHYRDLDLSFHPKTKFVDYPFSTTTKRLLTKNAVEHVMFLHSVLTKYRDPADLLAFLDSFKTLTCPGGSVIAAIDLTFLDFNRLTIDLDTISRGLEATRIGNTLVICR